MGYLNKGNEAKKALDEYLKLRPNLKTRDDFKKYLCQILILETF